MNAHNMFTWEGKRIAIKLIPPPPEPTKGGEPKFISICNRGEFLVESKAWFKVVVSAANSEGIVPYRSQCRGTNSGDMHKMRLKISKKI